MAFFDFGNPKQKQKTVQQLSPFTQDIQTIIARYLLMRLQGMNNPPMTFGDWRMSGQQSTPLSVLPGEGQSIPGLEPAPSGVNPILTNPKLRNLGRK